MSLPFLVLANHGNVYPLTLEIEHPSTLVDWTEKHFDYVRYNPRKDIERFGLSITSLDGGLSGIPDLDSLGEYNIENGTDLRDVDFDEPTPVFLNHDIQKVIEPWKDKIHRSHILKLGSGGFFPIHRDSSKLKISDFRLIVPLKNCQPPNCYFIIDDKITHWIHGKMYFVNTSKPHTLFNASMQPSYWMVFNVKCDEETAQLVLDHTSDR